MSDFAVIEAGTVVNVIVADTLSWVQQAFPSALAVQIDTLSPVPGIGWTYDSSTSTFVSPPAPAPPPAPATLVANPTTIPGNGATTSVVTWTAAQNSTAPPSVTFNVNGQLETVSTTSGVAQIQLTSTNAGDSIVVKCENLTVTVPVT